MSQARQSNLFAAESWVNIYKAFPQVNFSAYDFNSIKTALVEYLRQYYPEDFNDYIDSNEYIALIDMISYLGQSLAFRMDLNSQENSLDTATRRESILKLARMLSYKPKRNIASKGLIKITSLMCNDDLYDSNGTNLNGTVILWNDPNNPDWFEQFILVMNNVFVQSNPFGQPVEKAAFGSTKTQIYRLNNVKLNAGQIPFTASVDNSSIPFELINVTIEDGLTYGERAPDNNAAFHIIYQNDGNGNQSKNTGFFAMFKQGSLRYEDYNVVTPLENRLIEYQSTNVNESDVWVQTLDDSGNTLINWTKVPAIETNNIIYNDVEKNIRDIFTVQTLPENKISVRFGDGRFGNVPTGIIRCWHRVSENAALTIRPQNIRNLNINLPFLNKSNITKRVVFGVSLQETITNSQPNETDAEIKRRAPQLYYTQNRMVNGEDYNVFPLNNSTILKVKAINRIYSGHSRFIDINDPTGKHQNANVFADDGILYLDPANIHESVTVNDALSPIEIVTNVIQPMLYQEDFLNFIYQTMRHSINENFASQITITQDLFWKPSSQSTSNSTGVFVNSIGTTEPIGPNVSGFKRYIAPGALLKFERAGWVGVSSIAGNGNYITPTGIGSIVLAENVAVNDKIIAIMPRIRTRLSPSEIDEITSAILAENTFALMYDFQLDAWYLRTTDFGPYSMNEIDYTMTTSSAPDQSKSWLQLIEFKGNVDSSFWNVSNRGLKFVFESTTDVRFFFVNNKRVVNQITGLQNSDNINIFKTNGHPGYGIAKKNYKVWPSTIGATSVNYNRGEYVLYDGHFYVCLNTHTTPTGANPDDVWVKDYANWDFVEGNLPEDMIFNLSDTYMYQDGYQEPSRVIVTFTDHDQDGMIDNPEAFDEVVFGKVPSDSPNLLVHFQRYTSFDGYIYVKPIENVRWFANLNAANNDLIINANLWSNGDVIFTADTGYYELTNNVFLQAEPRKYHNRQGRADLDFQWKHFASIDERIDPAVTNVIDLYVLDRQYDFLLRQWIINNESFDSLPTPSSVEQLRIAYSEFNDTKMTSDQLIFHPVNYKMIIGSRADEELRATIKITKLNNATMSDGEIKTNVLNAINEYFGIGNWNFGDTFFFSELSTFIHQKLVTQIAGVVLVPSDEQSRFGNLYDIPCETDEIFISCATVDDIEIVRTFTDETLRMS